jgi:hypothetical protein
MNAHAVKISQARRTDGPRTAPLAADQAAQQNQQIEAMGAVKNWRATVMTPTKLMLCNPDGSPKHERFFKCKPDSCRIAWSKTANGNTIKWRNVESVFLGFAEPGGGVSHSTLGFTIATTQGEQIRVIASDAALRRQWTGSLQAMLDAASAGSKKGASPSASAAAKQVFRKHVTGWLEARKLGEHKDDILTSFDNINLPPREWVSMLNGMADDGVLDEFIESLSRGTAQPEPEPEPGAVDESFTAEVGELEQLGKEMGELEDDDDEEEEEGVPAEMNLSLGSLEKGMAMLEKTAAAAVEGVPPSAAQDGQSESLDDSLLDGLDDLA